MEVIREKVCQGISFDGNRISLEKNTFGLALLFLTPC
jgi:hypothetical protein